MESSRNNQVLKAVFISAYVFTELYIWLRFFISYFAVERKGIAVEFSAGIILTTSLSIATSLLFLFLIFRKNYGILFFIAINGMFLFIWNLTDPYLWKTAKAVEFDYLHFVILPLIGVLSYLVLRNEKNRFFDFNFNDESPKRFKPTINLMRAFLITFIVIGVIFFSYFLSQEGMDKFLIRYLIVFIVILLLKIIGFRQYKFSVLAFGIALCLAQMMLYKTMLFVVMPFTGDWNDGWAMIGIIFGLILDTAFGILLILLLLCVRSYFVRRNQLQKNTSFEE